MLLDGQRSLGVVAEATHLGDLRFLAEAAELVQAPAGGDDLPPPPTTHSFGNRRIHRQ